MRYRRRGRATRPNTSKVSYETKDLIEKFQNMQASNTIHKIELTELTKLINKRKVNDIAKHKTQVIEHTLMNGGSLKTVKRKQGTGKNKIYQLGDKESNVITNIDSIVEVVEEFYTDLYSRRKSSDGNKGGNGADEWDIPSVTKEEAQKTIAAMQRVKAAGEDQVTADLLKVGRKIVQEELTTLYTQCLKTSTVPESWNSANIIFNHKKGNVNGL